MREDWKKRLREVFYPYQREVLGDPTGVAFRHIIGSYRPAVPPIAPSATVACIGSCFAEEMSKSLSAQGKSVATVWLSERWNTAFALRHFIEQALDGTPFPDGFIGEAALKDVPDVMTQLGSADAFITTFGLSACWHEIASGRMVLDIAHGHSAGGITRAMMSHEMRQTTVAQNVEQIRGVIDVIRRHKADAPIILTLSPIPLLASMTEHPAVPSNVISKATLRIALHEVMQERLAGVYYWPSYEIVEWLTRHHGPIWAQDGADLRHLSPWVVTEIMKLFSGLYFAPAAAAAGDATP